MLCIKPDHPLLQLLIKKLASALIRCFPLEAMDILLYPSNGLRILKKDSNSAIARELFCLSADEAALSLYHVISSVNADHIVEDLAVIFDCKVETPPFVLGYIWEQNTKNLALGKVSLTDVKTDLLQERSCTFLWEEDYTNQ